MSDELKYLWAPWRMGYIRAPKNEFGPCLFCDKSNMGNDEDNLIVHRGEFSYVLMNLYPYNNGHLLIAPYRKVQILEELSNEESSEIMELSKECMKIIRKMMHTDGFNLGLNIGKAAGAGIEEHLHFHIVPRWNGDNNFMPSVGNTKVMVQGLEDTYDMLKPEFDRMVL